MSFCPRLISPASEAIFLFMYASRYGPSKNVFMIVSLITWRISLNCRGITPEPGRLHTRSNSILMAIQLVMPPAKPNRPAARIHRAASCIGVRGAGEPVSLQASASPPGVCEATLSAIPINITRNVHMLLMLPLLK